MASPIATIGNLAGRTMAASPVTRAATAGHPAVKPPTAGPPATADIVVVGAGPAGLAAAAALRAGGAGRVLLLDREQVAGGIPRHCAHSPYGLREFGRPMLGPAYAAALLRRATEAGVEILTGTTVTALLPGGEVEVTSDAGISRIVARLVLLTTGLREASRAERFIGGTKPGGILPVGALQAMVHLQGLRPFRRPVVLGSELVAFSALLTCRRAGIRPVAMIEPGRRITARNPSWLLPRVLGVPLHLRTSLLAVEGEARVRAVILRHSDCSEERLETDGLILTGAFRPEASLVRSSHLAFDPATGGPEVDEYGRCSDPCYFAAGNLLRPVETAGWSWTEGVAVAAAMRRALDGGLPGGPGLRLRMTGDALRYAMPQRIAGGDAPALTHLQIRLDRPARGELSLHAGGLLLARRRIDGLPERRILLPLPHPGAAAEPPELRLDEAPA